jgi:hypothetical protein
MTLLLLIPIIMIPSIPGKQKHEENHVWNGTVSRPRADSDSSNNNKGAVTKVIELFRHRSQSAVSAEDKRKAVSV